MPYIKAHIVIAEEEKNNLTIREGGFFATAENIYNIHEYDYNPALQDGKPRTCVELTPHKNGDKRFVIFNKPLKEVEDLLLNSHSATHRKKHGKISYKYNDMNNVMDCTLITLSQKDFTQHHDVYAKQQLLKHLAARDNERERQRQRMENILRSINKETRRGRF